MSWVAKRLVSQIGIFL